MNASIQGEYMIEITFTKNLIDFNNQLDFALKAGFPIQHNVYNSSNASAWFSSFNAPKGWVSAMIKKSH